MKNKLWISLLWVIMIGCGADTMLELEENDYPCEVDMANHELQPFTNAGHIIDRNYTFRIDTMALSPSPNCTNIKEIQDTFYFIENARKYLPQSSLDVGEKIFYVNEAGEFMYFEITLKDHAISKSYYTFPCDTLYGYCFNTERYELHMFSQDCKYQLKITVAGRVRGKEGNWLRRDGISIIDFNYYDGLISHFFHPLYEVSDIDAEYQESYTIQGEQYDNVYHMDQDTNMEVFYNAKYGLLAFIDDNEVEWKIYH